MQTRDPSVSGDRMVDRWHNNKCLEEGGNGWQMMDTCRLGRSQPIVDLSYLGNSQRRSMRAQHSNSQSHKMQVALVFILGSRWPVVDMCHTVKGSTHCWLIMAQSFTGWRSYTLIAKTAKHREPRSRATGGGDTTHEQGVAGLKSGICTSLWQSPHNIGLSCLRDSRRRITRSQHINWRGCEWWWCLA